MNFKKWLNENTESLVGKTVAVTGTTGGLGKELCRFLAGLGANLVLVDRNSKRSSSFRYELQTDFNISVKCIRIDLEDFDSVRGGAAMLSEADIDIFIHNAGAYSIPRHKCDSGYDNVFQINFISPYYIIKALLPSLRKKQGKVIVVSSIAHNYSKADESDIDFSTRKQASLVYGNAKRYLTFSLYRLFEKETDVTLSITHPGISFTGITAHYPKLIFAIIKYPMKVIFMNPRKASLSILKGVFDETRACEWIGPRVFNVWGLPKKQSLRTANDEEMNFINKTAEKIFTGLYQDMQI